MKIFIYLFISDKCVVGEVGSYCQLAVTFFWSHLTKPDDVVPQFILTSPFHKSGPIPDIITVKLCNHVCYKSFVIECKSSTIVKALDSYYP